MGSGCKKCGNIQAVLDKIEPDVELGRYVVVTEKIFNEIAELLGSTRRVDETKDRIRYESRYVQHQFDKEDDK